MHFIQAFLWSSFAIGFLVTSAGAQEVNATFDRTSAGNTNLCGAPVVAVDLTRFSWGNDIPIMPDSGTSESPNYVYRNLTSHMAVKATCVYEEKYKPEQVMVIPPDFDRCTVERGQFLCFRR